MPQPFLPAADPGLPISRQQVERAIDALVDLLDIIDGDTDLEPDLTGYSTGMDSREGDESDDENGNDDEPSLGSLGSSAYPGDQSLWGLQTLGCLDAEDEHDGGEPSEDGEPSLGWHNDGSQAHAALAGHWESRTDKEEDHGGAVRKKRPPSKTGRRIMVGAEVFK